VNGTNAEKKKVYDPRKERNGQISGRGKGLSYVRKGGKGDFRCRPLGKRKKNRKRSSLIGRSKVKQQAMTYQGKQKRESNYGTQEKEKLSQGEMKRGELLFSNV